MDAIRFILVISIALFVTAVLGLAFTLSRLLRRFSTTPG